MSGKIQGDKKEKSPAAKDMEYGIDSANIFLEEFQALWFQIAGLTGFSNIDRFSRKVRSVPLNISSIFSLYGLI